MIKKYPEVYKRIAYVVYTEEEAADRGLEIDHDDSHCFGDKPFALLVHGSQPAGSDASAAIQQRKKDGGFVGYARKNDLTPEQIDDLKDLYVERYVDNMSTKDGKQRHYIIMSTLMMMTEYVKKLPDNEFLNRAEDYW